MGQLFMDGGMRMLCAYDCRGLRFGMSSVLISLGGLVACNGESYEGPPDVIVLVLDACRPDRMGAYGYDRDTSPHLDRIAADPDATVFERHYVAGNWTKPSTASLFTSRYVHQHGVTNLPRLIDGQEYVAQSLPADLETMAEIFRTSGWKTIGLVTSQHLTPRYGFAQGFDEYFDPENTTYGDIARIEHLLRFAESTEEPYFAYVHQNACHYPYPPSDRSQEFLSRYPMEFDEAAAIARGVDYSTAQLRRSIELDGLELTVEEAEYLSLIYDSAMHLSDRESVGRLVDGLQRLSRWDRTLLIVTADHGEELYEHGGYSHGFSLWDEVIRVPLIVKFPRDDRPTDLGDRFDALSSNVDLLPSLLDTLALDSGDFELYGRQIFAQPSRGIVLSENERHGEKNYAVLKGRYKLMTRPDDEPLLFDLEVDPREYEDLAAEKREIVIELSSLLADLLRQSPTDAPRVESTLSERAIEQLRSLGYID